MSQNGFLGGFISVEYYLTVRLKDHPEEFIRYEVDGHEYFIHYTQPFYFIVEVSAKWFTLSSRDFILHMFKVLEKNQSLPSQVRLVVDIPSPSGGGTTQVELSPLLPEVFLQRWMADRRHKWGVVPE